MTASVSVILVSYHTGPTLWLTIDSALEQPECRELIIVNNGNPPAIEKRLLEFAASEPRIRFISGHGNVGFGKANNLGVSQATGDYVLLLNPDCMLPGNGLAIMLLEIAKYPENTLAGCYLMNPDGSEQRGGRRSLLNPANGIAESLGLGFLRVSDKLNFNNLPMPQNTHEVPAISGAFMFMARSFYQRLGGFDEGYFLHMEDMDFCYRVHQAGGKVICAPDVRVLHFKSTSEVTSTFLEKHKAKGFVRYLNKFFAEQYSANTLRFLEIGITIRCWIKILLGRINNIFIPPLEGKYEIARMALLYKLTRFSPQDEPLTGKTVIVTGATSQLGLAVVGKLLSRGAKVVAAYSDEEVMFSHPNLIWQGCDWEDSDDIAALAAMKADILVHAARPVVLADLLTSLGIKRVVALHECMHVSQEEGVLDEALRTGSENGCEMTILNVLMPYGIGLDKTITSVADIIKRFGFVVMYGEGSGVRNPAHALDAADVTLKILDNAVTYGRKYFLGGMGAVSYREIASRLFAYLGKPERFVTISLLPTILSVLGGVYQLNNVNGNIARDMNKDILFDNTQAIEDFGYQPSLFLRGDIIV